MKLSFFVFLISILCATILCTGSYCQSLGKTINKTEITKFQLQYNLPNIKEDGSLFIINNKIEVFTNNNFTLYRLPYVYTLEKDSKLIIEETRYSAFVFKKGTKYGLFYKDEFIQTNVSRADVDSVLKEQVFASMDFFYPELVDLIQTKTDSSSIEEIYAIKKKQDEFQYDSIYVYYNKQSAGIDYSMSKILDTSKLYKLYKFNLICSAFFSEKNKIEIPRREYIFELHKFDGISNADEQYFNSFINKLKE